MCRPTVTVSLPSRNQALLSQLNDVGLLQANSLVKNVQHDIPEAQENCQDRNELPRKRRSDLFLEQEQFLFPSYSENLHTQGVQVVLSHIPTEIMLPDLSLKSSFKSHCRNESVNNILGTIAELCPSLAYRPLLQSYMSKERKMTVEAPQFHFDPDEMEQISRQLIRWKISKHLSLLFMFLLYQIPFIHNDSSRSFVLRVLIYTRFLKVLNFWTVHNIDVPEHAIAQCFAANNTA